ncbi:hypothetical protein DFH09DRAFT_1090960 [Mycena vulgaris]|nr:hypothetical protein DFH09DRAFT_1090960 [Mycena vulgaris]
MTLTDPLMHQATLYTAQNGALPVYTSSLYCRPCKRRYHHNWAYLDIIRDIIDVLSAYTLGLSCPIPDFLAVRFALEEKPQCEMRKENEGVEGEWGAQRDRYWIAGGIVPGFIIFWGAAAARVGGSDSSCAKFPNLAEAPIARDTSIRGLSGVVTSCRSRKQQGGSGSAPKIRIEPHRQRVQYMMNQGDRGQERREHPSVQSN